MSLRARGPRYGRYASQSFVTRQQAKRMRRRRALRPRSVFNRSRPVYNIPGGNRRRYANYRTGGFMGLELKFLDTAWNSVAVGNSTDGSGGEMQPSSGCTNALSVPAQGDGESQRDGRKYTIKSIWVSGSVDIPLIQDQVDTNDLPNYFFALVLDTQANGATVVSENVYVNPTTQTAAMLPQPLRNLQNSKRYQILAHQTVMSGGAYAMADGVSTSSISTQHKSLLNLSWKGNLICDSTGTTADVASASDNAVHLVGYCDQITPGQPTFLGKCRVRFMG